MKVFSIFISILLSIFTISTLTGCENCNHRHKYIGTTINYPTCETAGLKEYKCEYCDDTYEEELPILWHTADKNDHCLRCNVKMEDTLSFYLNDKGDGYVVNGQTNRYYKDGLIIPSFYNELPVVEIAPSAFKNATIPIVKIPPTVKIIGAEAFSMATGFNKVIFYGDIERIGNNAFSGCITLKSCHFKGDVQTILSNAFKDCTYFSDVYFKNSESDYDSLTILNGNDFFLTAQKHYNTL